MGLHRLPNGREVFLVRFCMAGTYAGVLEGSARTASRFIREDLPAHAAQVLTPAQPLAVVDSSTDELPPWTCVAELESRKGVHNTDPDFNSRLYVCWFVSDTDGSVNQMVASTLPHVDWEGTAEDYDIMDF